MWDAALGQSKKLIYRNSTIFTIPYRAKIKNDF